MGSNDTDGDHIKDGTEFGLTLDDVFVAKWSLETNTLIWGTNLTHFQADIDPDTTTNPLRVDTDNDGIWDGYNDLNSNDIYDYTDSGEDVSCNGTAIGENETDATNPDTDGDGLIDGYDENFDGDAYLDNGETDPLDVDTDDDGLWDGYTVMYNYVTFAGELTWETSPRSNDTDCDGIRDGTEIGLFFSSSNPSEDKILDNVEAGEIWASLKATNITYFISDEDIKNTTSPVKDDSDFDGLIDGCEDENFNGRFENNKTETDPLNRDTDFDGIWDGIEDYNQDGHFNATGEDEIAGTLDDELNPNDADTDDDGIADGRERKWDEDTDLDGIINALDIDSDNDELNDSIEAGITVEDILEAGYGYYGTAEPFEGDADSDNTTDPLNPDTDGDGIIDGYEDHNHNGLFEDDKNETDPLNIDTDKDGLSDGTEDYNKDGYFNETGEDEIAGTLDDELNPNDCDTDEDWIRDGEEPYWNTDTDGDGLINALDYDSDNDNLTDGLEMGVPVSDKPVGGFGYNGTNDSYSGDADTSTTTDPLDIDTDGDGIPDGWIDGWTYTRTEGWHQNGTSVNYNTTKQIWEGEDLDLDGAYEPVIDTKSETNPNLKDTDDDGIPDGFEYALSAINLDDSFGLNPLNYSDAFTDLDNDLLNNLQEYQKGVIYYDFDIDFDDDGNINFFDNNDDGDPWLTLWEVGWGLEPYLNEYGIQYDFDGDGLDNKYEWDNNNFINFTTEDTDGDGLNDGWEYNYWKITRNQVEEWALTNCSRFDSDNDTANDGNELNGYEVTISWYEGEEFKSKEIMVFGDPMFAYKDQNDNYLDIDGDGIYDIDEVDPKNSTRLEWYFEVLEHDPRNQTAKDEQVQNQFNPFIKETIPPKIENVGIKTFAKYHTVEVLFVKIKIIDHCYSKITVEISDVSDFILYVKVLDNGKYVKFEGSGNEVFEVIIDIDFWTDYLLDYRVKIIAIDTAGNELEWEKKVNGVFGGLLDALAAIWDAIIGAFSAAFEAMAFALNFLLELFISLIEAAFNSILSSIESTIRYLFGPLVQEILSSFKQSSPVDYIGAVSTLTDLIFTPIYAVATIYYFLMCAEIALNGFTMGTNTLLSQVTARLVPGFIASIIGMTIITTTMMFTTESLEGVITVAEAFGAVTGTIEVYGSVFSALSFILLWALQGVKLIPAFAVSLIGLALAMNAGDLIRGLGQPGYYTFIFDLIATLLAVAGLFDIMTSTDEKLVKATAPIVNAIDEALSRITIVLVPLELAEHCLSGEWLRGWRD